MRLLLAEDERALSRALCKILDKNGYPTDPVYDGEEALEYLRSGAYDGLILDVMMPRKDGFAVLRELRESGNRIPVLMLTARTEVEDRVRGLDGGADDYLCKPFDTRELLARLRAMTRAPGAPAEGNRLRFGNVTLDRSSFELSTPSGRFHLTNKEYQLMELLISSPRRVQSTEALFARIWGLDSEAELSVVWVYVSYLRKKLKALEADAEIRAYRGSGYALEAADDT